MIPHFHVFVEFEAFSCKQTKVLFTFSVYVRTCVCVND